MADTDTAATFDNGGELIAAALIPEPEPSAVAAPDDTVANASLRAV